MKKLFAFFAAVLMSTSLFSTPASITVNAVVPAGTPACYFYGEMSGNTFVEMTKLDDTHYTIDFPDATTIGWGYRFVWEAGNWSTANSDPEGDFRVEPVNGVIDVEVRAWATVPAPAPAASYGIMVTGTPVIGTENPLPADPNVIEVFVLNQSLTAGQTVAIYDASSGATWAVPLDPASVAGIEMNDDRSYIVTADGCYDFYIKLEFENDQLYVGAGTGCGTTPTPGGDVSTVKTTYIDEEGVSNEVDAIEITNSSATLAAGWYVVNGTDVQTSTLVCEGEVKIILADGAKLTATGASHIAGIQVSGEGNSLTIYGQTAQSGQLIAKGGYDAAAIGGGSGFSGSNITINGGNITATGGESGAGIGGGNGGIGSNITINGGTVVATGGDDAAGIGGGHGADGSSITINGGDVTAIGGDGAAGIGGGGYRGVGSNITINGGTVVASGGYGGASIGNGMEASPDASNIKVTTNRIIKAGNSANPTDVITNTGADLASSLADKQYATIEPKPADPIPYITPVYNTANDPTSGIKQWDTLTCDDYKVITAADERITLGTTGTTSWYVVNDANVQLAMGAICAGNVNLIITDGAKLTAAPVYEDYLAGIQVDGSGNSFTIYAQSTDPTTMGQLIAKGGYTGAGIGSNYLQSSSPITINGGKITANGGEDIGAGIGGGMSGAGSNITINGGIINAIGKRSAGIGGGDGGSGSNIIINGGKVTANGNDGGAGIGGGYTGSGTNIIINSGEVIATGNSGAGIGGGNDGHGEHITINGGIITATGNDGAGIGGGGEDGICADVNIKGGTIMAIGGEGASAIGCGYTTSLVTSIKVDATLIVKAGTSTTLTNEDIVDHTSTQNITDDLIGKQYATIEPMPKPIPVSIDYIDENGEEQTASAYVVTDASTQVTLGTSGETSWYVVKDADVQLTKGAVCNGDVRLILADGAKLTATGEDSQAGIHVSGEDNSLSIYGQTAQSGQLIATGGDLAAGIGGGQRGIGSNITINGGVVVATGGDDASGIGGGTGANGSYITINGGDVTATGGDSGAGIGGGGNGTGSYITINGGSIKVNGGGSGAGIGGGTGMPGSNIIISGGVVEAIGGIRAAGIGGGSIGTGSNITINGGTVVASGGYGGASIGNGMEASPDASNIKVTTNRIIKAGNSANPTDVITNTGADLASSLADKQYATIEPMPKPIPVSIDYIDENGEEQTASAYVVADASTQVTLGTVGETSWYVVNGADVHLTKGAVCNGDVRLILADGAKLTATGWYDEEEYDGYAGIQVSGEGNSLSVYGQAAQTGQLIAQGSKDCAGIGSEKGVCVYNITINGGNITATGGGSGAGIGSGHKTHCYNITINGGTVEANGGKGAAGIGGGDGGNASNIVINGGTVTANGGTDCAGIGAGNNGVASDIFVATSMLVKAGKDENPTDVITNTGADLASSLADKQYATIEPAVVEPKVGDQFVDETSGLMFEVTSVKETKTVKVIPNGYTNTSYTIPVSVQYMGETFSVTEIGWHAFFDCVTLQSVTFLGNACQDAIGDDAFGNVGKETPVTLILPTDWNGSKPVNSETAWYGGYFNSLPITFIVPVIDQVNKQAVMLSHYPNGVSEYVDYIDYRWYRNGELVAEGVDNFREPSALNGCYHIEVPVDDTKSQWVPSNEICFQNGVFVGIDEIDEYNFSFSVVPNPVTKGSTMTVSTQLPEQQLQGASLMVYDLKGHIYTTMPMNQQSVTLTAEQTSGIYVIQITTRSGEMYVQEVIVR